MLTGIILAGGPNRRLSGRYKPLIPIGDEPLIHRQIRQMQPVCDEIIVVTNEPLPLLPVISSCVRVITDFIPDKGPLGGLHAALSLCEHSDAWVVGCDMPNISHQAAELMHEQKKRLSCDAIIPVIGCTSYLLHAIFHKSCVDAISAMLHSDQSEWTDLLRMIYWESMQESDFTSKGIDIDFVHRLLTEQDVKDFHSIV